MRLKDNGIGRDEEILITHQVINRKLDTFSYQSGQVTKNYRKIKEVQ